uniref:PDZ domain-containing protein n=1 Tax=Romanomermis culicivorax TaxID=13658 RepID=A0A915I1W1_ROMCU
MAASINQQPRLCHLVKQNSNQEYGFDLHSSKSRGGQFIGVVDNGSPAHDAGLQQNDLLIAVNGSPVHNMDHKEVVARIRQDPIQCYLTVRTIAPAAGDGDHHRRHSAAAMKSANVVVACWNYDDDHQGSETGSLDFRPSSEESYGVSPSSKYSKVSVFELFSAGERNAFDISQLIPLRSIQKMIQNIFVHF